MNMFLCESIRTFYSFPNLRLHQTRQELPVVLDLIFPASVPSSVAHLANALGDAAVSKVLVMTEI